MDPRLSDQAVRVQADKIMAGKLQVEKATSATSAARSKADKVEGEAKSSRKKLGQVKGEIPKIKVEFKEGYAAREKFEKERDELKDEVERLRKEVQVLFLPPLADFASSSLARFVTRLVHLADKKHFVSQRISKQV
ncbi:hypothetical protein JCM10295v2_006324 [Rhodotorula toruloides]